MLEDDDSIPISAVERYGFCPRQAYLFHAEGMRVDNRFTVEGTAVHKRVIDGEDERRGNRLTTRSLTLVCRRLRVHGVADVVEFRPGVVVPVEYKRGATKGRKSEWMQLCLQALCLEEMLGISIPEGYLYHDASHRKELVRFTEELRQETEAAVRAVRILIAQQHAPPPVLAPHCERCSLYEVCMPKTSHSSRSAKAWIDSMLGK